MSTVIWGVIGSALTLAVMIFKWKFDDAKRRLEALDAEDKKIDALTNADGIIRESGELRP